MRAHYSQGYMKTPQLNQVKQAFGFFSITIAWTLMNLLHSMYLAWTDGKADDSGVVIFWSGLFITISWAVFIIFPIGKLDHSTQIFKPLIFPFITGLYGAFTYSILIGGLFCSLDLVVMFIPLAILTGFIFGVAYSQLIRLDKLVDFFVRRPLLKSIFFLSPVIFLLFFLWLLPTIAPSLVFPYMPDEIRYKIVSRTIPKFKVGDDFKQLKNALPGYLDHVDDASGNMSATMEGFAFVLQVNCNKIIRLEYGNDQKDIDGTLYGELQNKPCP
ncbi:MAG: hypothetical protein ACKVOU_14145 [Cytophagales bacterium]